MKIKTIIIIFVLSTCFSGHAQIFGNNEWSVNFTNSTKSLTNVNWSEPDKIMILTNGLGWEGNTNEYRDFWIQSIPVAIGTSWRPARSANVVVSTTPETGELFVRYSPDKKHWSSWQALEDHHCLIEVPQIESAPYESLCFKYSRMEVLWASDEEAAVKWILQNDPKFFDKYLPFVGYVQFRMEGSFSGVQRIKAIDMQLSWGISGISNIPRDPNANKNRDGEWRFVGL